jgi:small-conductance mechanosensitive channel
MPSGSYSVYAVVVAASGLFLLWRFRQRIRNIEFARQENLDRLKRFDAVRTESPLDDPVEVARGHAHANVEIRFSLIRAALLPAWCLFIILLLVIPLLGEAPATVITLVGAVVGVIVGIAAKPALENCIAGIVISFAAPFRIGDTVNVDGLFGTVEDITFSHTMIKAWDWRRLMIPNQLMIAKQFINYSIVDRYQWAYVEFWVTPDADLTTVERLAIESAKSSPRFAKYEEPRFWVMEMGKEGIKCWVAAWADTPSAAWQLTHDIRTRLAADLRQAGIITHLFRFDFPKSPPSESPVATS